MPDLIRPYVVLCLPKFQVTVVDSLLVVGLVTVVSAASTILIYEACHRGTFRLEPENESIFQNCMLQYGSAVEL